MLPKLLQLVKNYQSDVVLALAVIIMTVISFNLGKLSMTHSLQGIDTSRSATKAVIYTPNPVISSAVKSNYHTDLSVVASKKSKSKYYHFSWCAGAKQISEANKVTFATEAEAITAGYKLASNCIK